MNGTNEMKSLYHTHFVSVRQQIERKERKKSWNKYSHQI